MYSKELMEIMKEYLDCIELNYDNDESENVLSYNVSFDDETFVWVNFIEVQLHSYTIRAGLSNIWVDDSNFNAVSKYLNLLNLGQPFAHFYVQEDVVMCTHQLNCNNILPNHKLLRNWLAAIEDVMIICHEGVTDIINGAGTAKEIFEKQKDEALK